MLLACVQSDVKFGDPQGNLKTILGHLEQLSGRAVALAVFTECALTGYGFDDRESAMKVALTIDSPIIEKLIEAAARWKIALTVGTLLREGKQLYNAALLIDGNGIQGRYHKIHLPHLGVDRFVDRGEIPYTAFELQNGCRVGLAICYDCSFPEPMRELALAGADVIALGTNWPIAAMRTAEVVPPARSMENHLFFAAANRVGTENGFTFCGRSSICGPDGIVLAQSNDDTETILIADFDPAAARNKRIQRTVGKHVIDRFADRQPAFYGRIVRPVQVDATEVVDTASALGYPRLADT